ncbi:putative amino acid transporter, transmembrane domain-containing protein [Helianthus annuus]|nr:putative amino acid transporter, transmembrane domain-containing protein [Helianthus annuus]
MVCNDNCRFIRLTYFIVIVASVNFVLSHLPSFNSISVLSLAATVASIRYSAKYIYSTRDELFIPNTCTSTIPVPVPI